MDIIEKFKEIISESAMPIVFEFGMCDGYHSNILISILNENDKPYIFNGCEPVKYIFDLINLQPNHLGKATKHNIAINDKDGVVDFYISGGSKIEDGDIVENYYGSSSLRKPKLVKEAWESMTFEKSSVETIKFDTLVKNCQLENQIIDFIWSDIQGAEIDLINGGVEAFKNTRYFFTEYNNSELYEGAINLTKICEMLPDWELVYDWGGDALLKNKNL
jgi:FkbM family methyltransferase